MGLNVKSSFEQFQGDPLVKKMINLLTRDGKKSKSEKILFKIFLFIQHNYPGQVLNIFYLAVVNAQVFVGTRTKPKGKKFRKSPGAKNFFIPYFIFNTKSQTWAIRSLFLAARKRDRIGGIWENLSKELLDAALFRGNVLEGRYESHSLSNINKRQYKYRWKRRLSADLGGSVTLNSVRSKFGH